MSVEREITMTVCKIEADLMNVSSAGREAYLPGFIHVTAQGGNESHQWTLKPGQRCWIGDRVTVTVIEDDPEPQDSTPPTPPLIDKRAPVPPRSSAPNPGVPERRDHPSTWWRTRRG